MYALCMRGEIRSRSKSVDHDEIHHRGATSSSLERQSEQYQETTWPPTKVRFTSGRTVVGLPAMTIEGGKTQRIQRQDSRGGAPEIHCKGKALRTGATRRLAPPLVSRTPNARQYLASRWLETVKPPVLEESTWRQHHYLVYLQALFFITLRGLGRRGSFPVVSTARVQALYDGKTCGGPLYPRPCTTFTRPCAPRP